MKNEKNSKNALKYSANIFRQTKSWRHLLNNLYSHLFWPRFDDLISHSHAFASSTSSASLAASVAASGSVSAS